VKRFFLRGPERILVGRSIPTNIVDLSVQSSHSFVKQKSPPKGGDFVF